MKNWCQYCTLPCCDSRTPEELMQAAMEGKDIGCLHGEICKQWEDAFMRRHPDANIMEVKNWVENQNPKVKGLEHYWELAEIYLKENR